MNPKNLILAVDDDPLNQEIFKELLEDDYDLHLAGDGEEAFKKALALQPDLVLLDIMMPGVSGYEVCRRIKAHPRMKRTKVILVSAKAMVQERIQGYEAGADDYITKPFDHEEFLAKVKVFLRLKTLEEVDSLKTRILALLAHETNTPLTSIILNAEILADHEEITDEERRELTRGVLQNAWRLHDFLGKARLLCMVKEGKISTERKSSDLSRLVQEISRKKKEGPLPSPGKVEVSGEAGPYLPVPEAFLRVALSAVLDTFLSAAKENETIQVHFRQEGENLEVRVSDQGSWSPTCDPEDLFNAMEIKDLDHHSQVSGLNLTLAKAAAGAAGGEVSLHCKPGEKTVFSLTLPLAAPVGERI